MAMKLAVLVAGLASIVVIGACNKPDMDDCRKAIDNMQHILGTDNISKNGDNEGDVRRCRGGSTKEAVACAIKATSLDDLKKCDFMKVPPKKKADDSDDDKKPGSGSGSDSK
jgi:hypothetical protein